MKYKSKLKWLISGLVLLSAASISAVAVACTPKNSSPTKPSKPNDTKKSNPQNSLSKPSDNKVSTPSKPKPNNPLSSQPKKNPSDTKKDSVDKTTKPSDPTNNQKDKDETGKNKVDKDQKDQKDQTPKMPETKKEDKDDSSRQMDGDGKQKSDTPNKMDDQNKPDNSNSSGSISNPKQPEVQNKPKESEKMEDVAPTEPAPKKDESKTGDDKSKQNGLESDSMGSKPKAEQTPKTKLDPPTDINNKKDKDPKEDQKQSEGQNQPPTKQQQQQQQQNGMGGQDLKPKETDPHPNQNGSGNNDSSAEENIDKSKPLLRFKDNQPQIDLYPGSNDGVLSLVFHKQDYKDELKDKNIVVVLKNENGKDKAHAIIQNIDENNAFNFVFKPIVESGRYKLESAFIFKNNGNRPDDKSMVNIVLTESDKSKTITVKKPQGKKQIPDTEKNKKAAIITLAESDNKLELSVKSKETDTTINGKYLKVVLLGLERDREQYSTPYDDISKNLLISNGKVMIPGFEISEQTKKTYSQIIVKVLGIYDNEESSEKSKTYRFDYGAENTLIDPNDNLILIKTLN
ncbi:Vmc-like lipoprotein signal peptide domain-containing protein [Ureaplasma diversum]|uniref:Uncharacterized protein n=1 Tax=Ureaplasma diversum NCTC 246 TaxID=1188241 RepID=A0A084F1N6_9BACT|nr:hypothetical protein [Ureaplasma diversum]KEZ24128.1 Hypothetical protein, predicted lipoprotein [Ureaplasma diversum NCTC 246]